MRAKFKTAGYFATIWLTATVITGWIHGSILAASIGTTTGTIISILVYQYYHQTGKPSHRELAHDLIDIKPLRWNHLRYIAIAIAVGIMTRLSLGTIHNLISPQTQNASHNIVTTPDPSLWYFAGLITMAIIIGPLLEELLFRNGLQKLLTTRLPSWAAITTTSIAFALLHIPSYGGFTAPLETLIVPMGVVFGDSLLFGWVYDRTQNVAVAMISHGLSNTVAVVITLISVL